MALGACAGSAPVPVNDAPTAPNTAQADVGFDDDVLLVGYQRIRDVYLHPVDFRKLSLDGLNGLHEIDQEVSFDASGDLLLVKTLDGDIGTYNMPKRQQAADWAELVAGVIADTRRQSPELTDASDDDIYAVVFDALLDDLDEFSRYVGPSNAENERANRDGYGGIGIVLDMDEEGRPQVREVFPGGPAEDAGIPSNSRILTVDGTTVIGLSLDELGTMMRGPANSLVTISLAHPDGEERNYRLRRRRVVPNAVTGQLDEGFAVVQVSRFNAATTEHLSNMILRLSQEHSGSLNGIILDLRGNPGGLLGQSVSVADLFIGSGDIIATRGRNPASVEVYRAKTNDVTGGLPMAVLIDGRSASASEVVAAALQDAGRAVLIGGSSYGKGSVQTVTRLPNNGELFLTWSELYTPSGITLHRQGVLPTICTTGVDISGLAKAEDVPYTYPEALSVVWEWRMRAARDTNAMQKLRALCPALPHAVDLDIDVAKQLLADSDLYAQAISNAGRDFIAMSPAPFGVGADEAAADPVDG